MINLDKKRVLVVEDEALIGAMIVEWLEEMGCQVVGPASRLAQGFALADTETIDTAVLDVNVHGERVYPLADHLRKRHVSLVFATGYGEQAADSTHGFPVLEKPFTFEQLARALADAGQMSAAASSR